MKKAAIIGGGISGLVAAYYLQKKGVDVTLFEASDALGGAIRSVHKDGYLAEAGPNTIVESSADVSELIEELGLTSRRVYANSVANKRFIVRDSKPVEVPSSPQTFFLSTLFSLGAKMKLLGEPFRPRIITEDESLADFTRRRLGQEFLNYAINPFVAGVYAGDPEKLSAKHAFPKITALEEKYGSLIKGQLGIAKERKRTGAAPRSHTKMFSFDDGLQVLIDMLASKLNGRIQYNSAAIKIERRVEKEKNIDITFASGERVDGFDSVILTAPAYKIADIEFISYPATPSTNPLPLYGLHDIYYPPVTSLALGFDRRDVNHPLDGFGMLIPKVEGFRILGTLFSSTLFPNRAPDDHVLLTTYIGGARYPELALLGDDELVKLVLGDLRVLLGVTAKPSFTARTTWQKAIPQYEVGYGEFKEMMTNFEKEYPGIYLAGNFRDGISLPDCIANAKAISSQ
ncbi:MAG TPA: protoporphyrinogen oxidase [Candidatus Kapabacteria bacterium]